MFQSWRGHALLIRKRNPAGVHRNRRVVPMWHMDPSASTPIVTERPCTTLPG